MSKKIQDIDSRKWTPEDFEQIKPKLNEYKYQISYKMPGGIIRSAFTDEPKIVEVYLKSINATIIKIIKQ